MEPPEGEDEDAPPRVPWSVGVPAALHVLAGVALAGASVFWLVAAVAEFGNGEGGRAPFLRAVVLAVAASLAWAAGRGLWRGRRGWRIYVLVTMGLDVVGASLGTVREARAGNVASAAGAALAAVTSFVVIVLLISPIARRHFGLPTRGAPHARAPQG